MMAAERLLMVPVILQAAMLLLAGLTARSPDPARAAVSSAILQRQAVLSIVFFALSLRWRHIADAPVMLFASLFVLATAANAVLLVRGDPIMAAYAIRAAVVALAGLAAMLLTAMAPS